MTTTFHSGNGFKVGDSASGGSVAKAKKILIVDDEPALLRLVESILSKDGFQHLIFCSSGDQVCATAVREKPQLIIMDVMMPGGNGLRALRSIRSTAAVERTPVIVMSGYDHCRVLGACAESLADAFLTKPFNSSDLLAHVTELLTREPQGTGVTISWGQAD